MKKLITSALPYVNNVPHLGNIIGCVLSADVFARYCRSQGYETLYICGTDEYGTATENKAREEGLTPQEVCDKYYTIHAEIYRDFNISFDAFGRTSTKEQTEIAHSIFKDLDKNGYISEHTSERTYCSHDKMFLADRYVEGTCPKCGSEDARGDQCDHCGSLLEPEILINSKCKICGKKPVLKSTTHLHLDMDRLQDKVEAWFNEQSVRGVWTNNALTTTRGWLDRGLTSRPITRDLKWGTPVPKPGFEGKVFYVWFDAPIGYISITAKAIPEWEKWWLNPDEVQLYQFMAKDNIPFHTVIFPASLIGTGQPWTLLHHINSTEYLNYEDSKFSKSRGTGVFGTDVKRTAIPIDLWRFYLLAIRPEKNDSAFSWNKFFGKVNFEFTDNIGNLVNRILVYLEKNFGGEIKDLPWSGIQGEFIKDCQGQIEKITAAMEESKLREGLRLILLLGKMSNKFFQDSEPWAKIKTDRDDVHATVSILTYLIRNLAILLEPYMPVTAKRLFEMLNFKPLSENGPLWQLSTQFKGLDSHRIGKPEILYKKLDMKNAEKWKKRFSGEIAEFSTLNVKVGKILKVDFHPNAKHLYVMEVDIGEEKPRIICAGLVYTFGVEDLINRNILVLTNLKKADLSGIVSEGMILTAEKRKEIDLFELSEVQVGDTLLAEGQAPVNREIGIEEFEKVELSIKDGHMMWEDQIITVSKKPVRTVELQNGKIR